MHVSAAYMNTASCHQAKSMTNMQPPLSPSLADLRTNFSDLTLLDESDDLLSPSVLGAAAASKVRAARSPVKGNFRPRNAIPRARSSSLSTPVSLQTLEEEDEAHDGADHSPPLPAVPSQLPQPRRCESPPDTPDASRFSPALAAMQASVAASRQVDAEVCTALLSALVCRQPDPAPIALGLGSPAVDAALCMRQGKGVTPGIMLDDLTSVLLRPINRSGTARGCWARWTWRRCAPPLQGCRRAGCHLAAPAAARRCPGRLQVCTAMLPPNFDKLYVWQLAPAAELAIRETWLHGA